MKKTIIAGTIAALTLGFSVTIARTQLPDKRSTFMRAKLGHAQKLLEALTQEDYAEMANQAQGMKTLSQDASWEIYKGAEYEQRSVAFRRSADDLTDAAKRKNLDGATLSYVEMTMNCVGCHKQIRRQRDVRKD